jgi:hypothetical protein
MTPRDDRKDGSAMSEQTAEQTSEQIDVLDEITADDVLADVRSAARAMTRGGFATYDDVLSRCLELAALSAVTPRAGTVERVVRQEWEAGLAAQRGWTGEESDDRRLDAAFAELQAEGVFARASLGDCLECGEREARALAGPAARGYVFFPASAVDTLSAGTLRLASGTPDGDPARAAELARRVVATLERHGLAATADDDGIVVRVPHWRRRLPGVRGSVA